MIATIKRFFAQPDAAPTPHQLRLAGAMLLLEVGYADFDLGDAERKTLNSRLAVRFSLSDEELDSLIEHAIEQRRHIAAQHGVSEADLVRANPGIPINKATNAWHTLTIGQKILIPKH